MVFDKSQKIEVSLSEMAVIKAALHTQSKILDIQASAGGNAARAKLNEVKQVLANLSQQTPVEKKPCRGRAFEWFRASWLFG